MDDTSRKREPIGTQKVATSKQRVTKVHKQIDLDTSRFQERKNDLLLMLAGCPLPPFCRSWIPCWRTLDFEGPIRPVFLYVFGATAKTTKNMYLLTTVPTVPLKLENAKQQRT